MGLDRTYHDHQYIFSFFIHFCYFRVHGIGYIKLAIRPSTFYCILNTQYRIVCYTREF